MEMEAKKYKCDLKRKHVFLFSRIIKKLNIDFSNLEIEGLDEMKIGMNVLKLISENLHLVEKESGELICSIYNISPEHLDKIGLEKELELWKEIFTGKETKDFFRKAFLFLEKAKEDKKISSTADMPYLNPS